MTLAFAPAKKQGSFLRMALVGPAGSGKTYSALSVASALGKKIAVIDTEAGSASKYADRFQFDTLCPDSFSPDLYVEAIEAAEKAGYEVIVIDSLSHAWIGKDGALEQVDRAAASSKSGNSYVAWRNVTPKHNALVDKLVRCQAHLIATMRTKTEYVQEKDERTGKLQVRKVGLAPVQRDSLEYEFDVVGDMDQDNNLIVTKSRCPDLSGKIVAKPDARLAATLKAWLGDNPVVTAPAHPASLPPSTEVNQTRPVDESAEKAAMGGKMAELKGRFDKAGIGAEWKKVRDTRLPWPFPGTLAELKTLVAELEAMVGTAENATPPEAPNASEEIVDAALSVKQSKARIGLIKREWLKLCGNNMETRDSEWAAWATKEGANLDDEKSEDHLLLSLYVGVMERGLKARKERK